MSRTKHFMGFRSGSMERQLTDSDCAVWAIKAICFQVGVSIPPANFVRKHIAIENGGTTIRDVRDALLELGVSAQPVQGPVEAIAQAPLPAIAMIRLEDEAFHYVVVLEANHRCVKYLDPGVGGSAQTICAKKFATQFTGNLVLCERQPDYVAVNFDAEVKPSKFLIGALSSEANAAFALGVGEVFQLLMLLIGILMLKNFFGSSMMGFPNFWFLAGIVLCAAIYVWVGSLQQVIKADVKSRCLLSLFGFATKLIKDCDFDPKKGMRETSGRCIQAVSVVASSLANTVSLPGATFSVILFVSLVAWVDPWAGAYALILALLLPLIGLWTMRRSRFAQKQVAMQKNRNEVALVYLMAKSESDNDIVADMPWSQLAFCDALAKQDESASIDPIVAAAVGRMSIFAGLLIGGLQHEALGMGHTVAVFFLLSIYSSVVGRWSRLIASVPHSRFQIRSLLDLLSDFTTKPLNFSSISDSENVPATDGVTHLNNVSHTALGDAR